MIAREGKNHAPMAALEVALPGAAAIGLKQFLAREAERVEIGVTGDFNFIGIGKAVPGIGGDYASGESAIGAFICQWLLRSETSIEEKLPGGTRQDETML